MFHDHGSSSGGSGLVLVSKSLMVMSCKWSFGHWLRILLCRSVAIVMILIIVHHFMYDRDPRAVPPYVRRALQFDSDTDSEVDESGGRNKKETKIVEIEVEESGRHDPL